MMAMINTKCSKNIGALYLHETYNSPWNIWRLQPYSVHTLFVRCEVRSESETTYLVVAYVEASQGPLYLCFCQHSSQVYFVGQGFCSHRVELLPQVINSIHSCRPGIPLPVWAEGTNRLDFKSFKKRSGALPVLLSRTVVKCLKSFSNENLFSCPEECEFSSSTGMTYSKEIKLFLVGFFSHIFCSCITLLAIIKYSLHQMDYHLCFLPGKSSPAILALFCKKEKDLQLWSRWNKTPSHHLSLGTQIVWIMKT